MLLVKKILLAIIAVTMVGCTHENEDDCHNPIVLQLKISTDNDGKPQKDAVNDATLYIFDQATQAYLGTKVLTLDQIKNEAYINLDYPANKNIIAVVWANTHNDAADITPFSDDSNISNSRLALKKEGDLYSKFAPDLFYGFLEIYQNEAAKAAKVHQIIINRHVSSIVITTKGLQGWAGAVNSNKDFSFVIRETKNAFNFFGNILGDNILFQPSLTFKDQNILTQVNNLIPSTDSDKIELDIYHKGNLIFTLDKDEHGNPIKAVRRVLLNIFIDFTNTGSISVTATISPWGEVIQFVEV